MGDNLYHAEDRAPACTLPLSYIPSPFDFQNVFLGTAVERVAEEQASQLKADSESWKTTRLLVTSQQLRGPVVGRNNWILREVSIESGGDPSAPSPSAKGAAFHKALFTFRKLKISSSFDSVLLVTWGSSVGITFILL